jgi:hypothetical protein
MTDLRSLLAALRTGRREFKREEFVDLYEFESVVQNLREANKLGFLKGYRVCRAKSPEEEIIQVSASHGLSDDGLDYLIRIGG